MKRVALVLLVTGFAFPALAQTPTTPAIAAMVCANNTVVPTPTNGQFFYVQCDSNGKLITTGSATTPGGSPTQVQYNAAGSFGGISGATSDGTTLTLVAPVLGAATGTSLALNGATIGANAIAGIGQFASYGATTTGPGFYSYLNGDTVARVRIGLDANDTPSLAFGPGGATTRDTFLMRTAAATAQFGQTDVDTAPVAQTLRTQGTLAGGTSNVAGANWTLIASPGKGTGTGGSIIFQTAPAGSTGTAVNAPVTALTIDSTQRVTVSAGITNSGNGAASIAQSLWNGTVLTGGTATTNFPAMLVQPTGTSAVTSWSTSGTGLGMNLASGFAGNFLDFHAAGAASVFNVTAAGAINTAGLISTTNAVTATTFVRAFTDLIGGASTSRLNLNGDTFISRPAANSIQLGSQDASTASAQTLRVQSVVAGTAAANGANWTLIGSLPTGTGTSGDIIIQTGVKTGSGTTQGTATTAITVKGETQEVRLPQIATDGGLTDTTVCQDTTNHGLRSGSGALGVCLGTSGRQFKTDFSPMQAGLAEVMKINLWNYRYKPGHGDNGARMQYGPTAQDVEAVLPDLAGHDSQGETINYDWGAFIPIMMRAIQQQQVEIKSLQAKLEAKKQEN